MQRVGGVVARLPTVAAAATARLRGVEAHLGAAPLSEAGAADLSTHASSDGESFIDLIKRMGVNAVLGSFTTSSARFDRTLDGLRVTRIDSSRGEIDADIVVSDSLSNTYGTLHGGAICTLVDVVGTLAILTKDHTKAGVSVELSTSFVSAAKKGTTVRCTGRLLKLGGKLAFTTVDIFALDKDGTTGALVLGKLVATGRHTKAV
jgi:acyl-coenzyme A thioesterase 13